MLGPCQTSSSSLIHHHKQTFQPSCPWIAQCQAHSHFRSASRRCEIMPRQFLPTLADQCATGARMSCSQVSSFSFSCQEICQHLHCACDATLNEGPCLRSFDVCHILVEDFPLCDCAIIPGPCQVRDRVESERGDRARFESKTGTEPAPRNLSSCCLPHMHLPEAKIPQKP